MRRQSLKPTQGWAFVFVLRASRGGQYVGFFSDAVVRAFTEAGAAEVEAQAGKANPHWGRWDLHGVVDDFVMESAAAQGMGMRDQCRERELERLR